MKRSQFLKLLSGGLASASAPLLFHQSSRAKELSYSSLNKNRARQRVLIVGAGIAGLAAAQTLVDAGSEVVLIEARDRIGGRIWTSNAWSGVPMDMGASWIHGIINNPIYRIAEQINTPTVVTRYGRSEDFDTTGSQLNTQKQRQLKIIKKQISRALRQGQNADIDHSIQHTVKQALNWKSLSRQERRLVNFVINTDIEQEYAGSSQRLSTYWYDSGNYFGGDDVLFPDGYETITNTLAEGLTIRLNQPVTRIEARQRGVTVTTTTREFVGDYAIVTLPLGVLKRGNITFSPSLPRTMQQAIDTLEMGVLNKCYLRFPSIFWNSELDWFQYNSAMRGQWNVWLSLTRSLGQPILLGFNAAEFGEAIEQWSDQDIVSSAMDTLRTIYGQHIPDPIDYQITRWKSDPYSLGSYSFQTVGSHPRMRDDLAGNINDRIFFAGEATSRKYASTVHGAYLSGIDAAKQLV